MSIYSAPTLRARMSSRTAFNSFARALASETADDYLEGDETSHTRLDGPFDDVADWFEQPLTVQESAWLRSRAGIIVSRRNGAESGGTVHWYASVDSLESAWDTLLDLQGRGQL